jgi:hypothetical protein
VASAMKSMPLKIDLRYPFVAETACYQTVLSKCRVRRHPSYVTTLFALIFNCDSVADTGHVAIGPNTYSHHIKCGIGQRNIRHPHIVAPRGIMVRPPILIAPYATCRFRCIHVNFDVPTIVYTSY